MGGGGGSAIRKPGFCIESVVLPSQGVRNSSYQKRWFVLKGNLLFYKERRSERELLGVLVLEGCSVQLCESDERFAFSVVWSESHVTGGRTYKLAAEDQPTQESWLKALLSANHAYLQLLLMDLEARYRGERWIGLWVRSLCPLFTVIQRDALIPSCS